MYATTYYVDHTNGLDSNNGTSKSTPWKHAPGMYSASSNASGTTINPGDSVILKGCVTWGETSGDYSFPWRPATSGTSGNVIYYGVDKTWWDSTVTGCSTSWNRPIMNPNGQTTDPGSSGLEILFDNRGASYITWDNFEVINWYTYPDTSSGSNEAVGWHVSSASSGASFNTIENMYVHGWINPYMSVGTGNITASSCTITNYVPYSYSNSPAASWTSAPGGMRLQSLPQGTNIPEGNSSPTVTSITGSNPYTLVFTNTAGCPTGTVTGAVIQVGLDVGVIVSGNSAGDTGTVVQDNVFDGSDTAEAQWNTPVSSGLDCQSNNELCAASVEVGRQGPQIWRNNVMRYVSNGFIGSSSEMSGNRIEYIRLGTDPTGHTNIWEDQPCLAISSNCLYFNNVIGHMNNANSSIPGGQWNIGETLAAAPTSGVTGWMFNNVMYDITQSPDVQLNTDCSGCGAGTWNMLNNTLLGGPEGSATYQIIQGCAVTACLFENNHFISSNAAPYGTCSGGGCTSTTPLVQTEATANSDGYTISQTYTFSPTASNSPTVGTGTNATSTCNLIAQAAAQTACKSDTVYAVGYNTTNHTVIVPGRTTNSRPASGAWDVGAYEYQASLPNGIGIAPGVGLAPGVAIAP
jgi:hypothetical protein